VSAILLLLVTVFTLGSALAAAGPSSSENWSVDEDRG